MAQPASATLAPPLNSAAAPAEGSTPSALANLVTQVQPGQQLPRQPARRRPTGQKPAGPAAKPASRPAQSAAPAPAPAAATKQAEATNEKPRSPPQQSAAPAAKPSTAPRSASPRKKKQKKPGFFEGLIAFLTCSTVGAVAESQREGTSRNAPQLPKYGRGQTGSTEQKETPPSTSAAAPATPSTPAEPIDAAALASQEAQANSSREGATLPRDETGDVLSGAVVPPGKEGGTPGRKKRKSRASTPALATGDVVAGTEEPETSEASEDEEDEEYVETDDEDRLISQGGMGIPLDEEGKPRPLLAEVAAVDKGRKCLVLDLDETLLHSSFKMIHSADFVVPVEIENQLHNVYVIKRPGVDLFLQKMGEVYEVVVFTASLSKYADPVLDCLDIHHVVKHRLFRESCYNHRGNYVKDLSQLGRPIGETIIIDNSPASYIFHPKNAVPVSSWFNDPHDTELTDLLGVLTDLADVPDVRGVLDTYLDTDAGLGPGDQSMEQLSSIATATAQEHSTTQHQSQQVAAA